MDLMTDDTFVAGILERPRRGEATGVLMYHERSPLLIDLLMWQPSNALGIHRSMVRADLRDAVRGRSIRYGDVSIARAADAVRVTVGFGVDAVTALLELADVRRFLDATESIVPATDIDETRALDRLADDLRRDPGAWGRT